MSAHPSTDPTLRINPGQLLFGTHLDERTANGYTGHATIPAGMLRREPGRIGPLADMLAGYAGTTAHPDGMFPTSSLRIDFIGQLGDDATLVEGQGELVCASDDDWVSTARMRVGSHDIAIATGRFVRARSERVGILPDQEIPLVAIDRPLEESIGLDLRIERGTGASGLLPVVPALGNAAGMLHGGVQLAAAERVMSLGLTAHTNSKQTRLADISVHYLAPATGGLVHIQSVIQRSGRNMSVLTASLTCGDRLLAVATGAYNH